MNSEERTRRRWLATCAGAAVGMTALAGCTGDSNDPATTAPEDDAVGDDNSNADPEGGEDGNFGNWPMIHYDAANRLSVPHDGLDGEPDILWTAELEGTVSPPVVYDGSAFVSHGNGFYTAIDLENGESIWQHETVDRGAPAASETAVFVAGDGVEALSPDTGDVLWKTDHEASVQSLRVFDRQVYAGLDDQVLVLTEEGEELLEIDVAATVQSLAIDEERIYVRLRLGLDEDDFVITAYNRDTGDHLWQHHVYHAEQWFDDRHTKTSPLINGTIYAIHDDAIISIAGSDGELIDLVELERPSWTRPTIHNNQAYVHSGGLTGYNLDTGEQLKEWIPEESTRESIVATRNEIYAVRGTGFSSPQNIVAMDLVTGEVNWEKQVIELSSNHIPIVLNDLILLPIDEPGLIAFG